MPGMTREMTTAKSIFLFCLNFSMKDLNCGDSTFFLTKETWDTNLPMR